MDKFVTRAPSWKVKSYPTAGNVVGFGRKRSGITNAATTSKETENKKSPRRSVLQELKECDGKGRRLSTFDARLLKILSSQPDQPLVEMANGSDSGCSSSSDNFTHEFALGQQQQQLQPELDDRENTPPSFVICGKTRLNLDDPTAESNQAAAKQQQNEEVLPCEDNDGSGAVAAAEGRRSATQNEMLDGVTDLTCTPPPVENPVIMRIQRDLNSPSASLRLRALKAMQSPTKSAYAQFDIPHAEQSIITAEDRRPPEAPKSIQELMRKIIVYVEVRTGEDNRSAGVKKVISALGARVNDKLLRDTTHVIFKDGLLSTYKKAKQWNIPIVSILWIEACKNERRICDPSNFPISSIDRYENPELYEKMKRHKSMQPDSEVNKRVRVKATTTATTPNTTPRTGAVKKTLASATPQTPNGLKKTDISRFFTQLGSNKKSPIVGDEWNCCDTPTVPANSTTNVVPESPATELVNKMNSDYYTILPNLNRNLQPVFIQQSLSAAPQSSDGKMNVPSAAAVATEETPTNKMQRVSNRRRSKIHVQTSIEATMLSMRDMSLEQSQIAVKASIGCSRTATTTTRTPQNKLRHRSNINEIVAIATNLGNSNKGTLECFVEHKEVEEEYTKSISEIADGKEAFNAPTTTVPTLVDMTVTPTRRSSYRTTRKTTYTPRPLEISAAEQTNSAAKLLQNADAAANVATKRAAVRRRTLFTPHKIEESVSNDDVAPSAKSRNPSANSMLKQQFSDSQLNTKVTTKTPQAIKPAVMNAEMDAIGAAALQTPPQQTAGGTLLEQQALVFSSTRAPGRRRTLFDVSMDIITQRLQNINKSARRSTAVAKQRSGSLGESQAEAEKETPKQVPMPSKAMPSSIENISDAAVVMSAKRTQCDELTAKLSGVEQQQQQQQQETTIPTTTKAVSEDIPAPAKKRRKLFVPNECLLLTPPSLTTNSSNSSIASKTTPAASRRRRTLMPIVQSENDDSKLAAVKQTAGRAQRRSTMDFEDVNRTKKPVTTTVPLITSTYNSNDEKKIDVVDVVTSAAAAMAPNSTKNSASVEEKRKNGDNVDAKPHSNSRAPTEVSRLRATDRCGRKQMSPNPSLVYTNMRKEQIEVIKEAVAKLGSFQLEDNVTDATTHIVSLEPRRTMNLLRALLRGLWILEYTWIKDSLEARAWLNEEPYELRDFSRAVEICRSERQAFGKDYNCELFATLGSFYVSSRCGSIPKDNLLELIRLSGGKIADQRKRAKYILGHANRMLEDKVYITPHWILDSITHMQLQKFSKYASAAAISDSSTTTQTPVAKQQNNWQPYSQI